MIEYVCTVLDGFAPLVGLLDGFSLYERINHSRHSFLGRILDGFRRKKACDPHAPAGKSLPDPLNIGITFIRSSDEEQGTPVYLHDLVNDRCC